MLALALAASFLVVRSFALELGAALVLGYLTERPVAWALHRLGRAHSTGWRWAVTVGVVLLTSLVFLGPAAIAVGVAVDEVAGLIATLRLDAVVRSPAAVQAWLDAHLGSLARAVPVSSLVTRAQGVAGAAGAWAARATGHMLAATPDAVFSLVVVSSAWVSFAVEGPAMREAVLPRFLPWERERALIRRTTAEVVEGVVLANVGVSVVQAALVTVATIATGIPHAVVWGVASFVLSFVPLLGTAAVTLSAAAYLFAQGRSGAGVAMLVVAAIAGGVDNVLRPLLARSEAELPFVWMMVAFVGGVTAFGAAGVILGPLALSLAVALWNLRDDDDADQPPSRGGGAP